LKSETLPPNKLIVFDAWSDYGHFRNYTSTSPLTYPFPPRTALTGLIAALLGYEKDSYHQFFNEGSAFALQLLNPVKKIKIGHNLIDTKIGLYLWKTEGQRTQIPFEYLKNPKFRIYVWLNGELFDKLKNLLKEHQSIYTPYFGIASCISNFELIGVYAVKEKRVNGGIIHIKSVIPLLDDYNFEVEEGKKYGRIRLPYLMNEERVVLKFLDFIYEEDGNPIAISKGNYYETNSGERIVLF
jgi:CRISPR-associated protein Cas5h